MREISQHLNKIQTMKKIQKFTFSVAAMLILQLASGQDNKELQEMADNDQQARFASNIDWKVLNKEDSLRQIKVDEFFKENKIKTAKDFYNAGIIFQHGKDTVASKKAVEYFGKAIEMDSTLNRWWYAAAVDRDLMRREEPQIYGTQFVKNKTTNNLWKRYEIDITIITDKQRKYYKVGTLAEQRERERLMNLKSISSFSKENTMNQVVTLIKTEFKKGKQSEYDVTENAINNLGYELMNENKTLEALKIFELNTKLYPNGYNTYDSYGECLLKLSKTKKAIKAYKKSIELNPENENAVKVLSQIEK